MGQFSMGGFGGGFGGKSDDSDDSGESSGSQKPGGFSFGDMPEGFDPESLPEGFDPKNMPEGTDSEKRPDVGSFSFGNRPSSGGFGPGSFKPGDSTEELNQKKLKNLATYGICLALALAGLGIVTAYKRRR